MGGTCCSPDGSLNCGFSSTPNLTTVASVTYKEDASDLPKAPKVTSRLINGAMDPEVYNKTLQAELSKLPKKQVVFLKDVIVRMQAYVRRRIAKQKVARMREEQVVQHYMDPAVQALKPQYIHLQSTPARANENLREVAQELAFNTKAAWKRPGSL
ncbi:unnamed protein product [Effrenium voratum]|nr:unnamed protein product [Effrenium voratum]